MGEFDLIARHFSRPVRAAVLGGGDDCALISLSPGHQLAISTDTLNEGRHFLSTVDPEALGHKALAVNLSDLAACGATPRAFTLALSLPRVDDAWLAALARGLYALAERTGCELIGGDTTQGPLSLTVTVLGEVPAGQALLRSGARVGDDLWVSGEIGSARLALEVFRGRVASAALGDPGAFDTLRRAMEWPEPRVALGQALRGLATAAIDVSDGLLGDLQHLLDRSSVGARLHVDAVPCATVVAGLAIESRREMTLAGGDDYELLFTAPSGAETRVVAAGRQAGVPVTRIGRIELAPGLRLVDAHGGPVAPRYAGFDHFAPGAAR
jgi:thiamine-monophosphate kinase